MPIKPSSFLVLSDIHFGELAVSKDFALPRQPPKHEIHGAVPMKEALIATVKKNAASLSGILVPGDLTSVASPGEFQGSVQTVYDIASALGVDKRNVFFTFGNHDVDWRVSALSAADDKDELYNIVAARTGSFFVTNEPSEHGPVPGSGIFARDGYTVFAANSGLHCYKEQDYRHGKLGTEQLDWLRHALTKHRDGFRVAMVHHHPFKYPFATVVQDISCLEEGAELAHLLGTEGVHLVCHGHRHEPKIFTQMQTHWQHGVTFVCAGSVAVNEHHRNRGEIPNLFHLLFVDQQLSSGAAFGRLTTFRYRSAQGWIPVEYEASTPLDHNQHYGSVANAAEREAVASAIITTAIGQAAAEKMALLPAFETLSPDLKCMFLHELNTLLNRLAINAGAQLIGRYPDYVCIKL